MSGIQELKCQNCFAPLNVSGARSGIVTCDFCQTQNAMPKDVRVIQAEDNQQFVVTMMRAMTDQLSLADINSVCVELSGATRMRIDYDDISGEGKPGKCRELVLFCRRRGTLQALLNSIIAVNPAFVIAI